MDRAQLPLNSLRAFEASARHLNFTRAGSELCVSQGAVSHQVALLERRLGVSLFRRLPRGLALTDEGLALVPVVAEAFDRIGASLDRYSGGRFREVLTVGVVGTFAVGWLLPRVEDFASRHPHIDLRILTNNNRVDLAGEGLDLAIRYGDGAWHATRSELILKTSLSPLCSPVVGRRLKEPSDLARERLFRSYRPEEWPAWFAAASLPCPSLTGPMFDSSALMASAAIGGIGVALAPPTLFAADLSSGRLVKPFKIEIALGAYWLTRMNSRPETAAMLAFRDWLRSGV